MLRVTAVAHVHADDVHPRCPGFAARANHILRFAGAFKSMHDDDGHRGFALGLPMAMAQHPDFRFDQKQPLLRRRKQVASRQEVSGNRLGMAADEGPARTKRLAKEIGLLRHLGVRKAKLRRTPSRLVVRKDGPSSCIYNDVLMVAADSL